MAKRFTDSEKWKDAWFMDLPSKYKLFWLYLLDECNHAGIWKVNFKISTFYIGEHLEYSEVKRLLKPGGVAYFRANQNDHDKDHQGTLRYYNWSVEKVLEWAYKFNFEIVGEVELKEGRANDRMNREFVAKKRSNIRLFWKWKSI